MIRHMKHSVRSEDAALPPRMKHVTTYVGAPA